jgi:PAS domain S-box-containing protein
MTLTESSINIKELTEQLRQSELKFQNLIESAPDAIVIVDRDGNIRMINGQTEKLFGYSKSELYGKKPEFLIPERYEASHINYREEYTQKPKNRFMGEGKELKAKRKDGSEFNVEIALSNIGDKTQGEILILAAIRDITGRKQAEIRLIKAEQRFRRLIESAPDAMVIVNGEGVIQLVNMQTEKLFGYNKDELEGQKVEMLMPSKYSSIHVKHREIFSDNPKNRFMGEGRELMGRKKNGSEFNIEIALSPIEGEPGDEMLISAAIRDTTSRTVIENQIRELNRTLENRVRQRTEELEKSLNEKVIMLQEIHHRVKNNLQTVSSLLRIQSDKIPGNPAVEYLRASEQRIRSMALIHMQLYKTKDFSRINFKEYTEELCKYLLGAFGVNSGKIKLVMEIDDIYFAIDTALPCGLIINEMFTNSVKHAFPLGREGTILIKIYKDKSGMNHLIFKDDGIGMDKDTLTDNPTKLGMLLINTLTEQLEGDIIINTNAGTAFNLQFKDVEHNTHYRA